MVNAPIMNAADTVQGSMGECYMTLDGRRINLMQLVNISANIEKTKEQVPILGKVGKGNKSTGWSGSGSATMHYGSPQLRKAFAEYAKTGKDFYFDIQLTNEDPTSTIGRQTVILKECNMDSYLLAQLDTDSSYLDEDFDFTFEDFEIPEEFKDLEGTL